VTTDLLQIKGLSVEYDGDRPVRAVDNVSLTVRRGEILGIAGESGSGKSTLVTAVTRLDRPPARVISGNVLYQAEGREQVDVLALSRAEMRVLRWEHVAVVFQSAMNALNPVMRLGTQFADVLKEHRRLRRAEAWLRAGELLELVGIPADRVRSYPHELSGGMRQRATIALALACEPELIIMDEPTTAVDVVMQRQILRRAINLKRQLGFAVVFVTHDLSLLVEIADRIAIMYAGRVVELGGARDLYRDPQHPYTRGLRDAFPPLHGKRRTLQGIGGSPPDLRRPPVGCAFHPRCHAAFTPCREHQPPKIPVGDREVACWLHDISKAQVHEPHPEAVQ